MEKWISIIALILVVVFASGCTAQSSAKTYSSNNISFQYPGNWSTDYNSSLQNLGNEGDVLVTLGKDNSGMAVAKADTGSSNISASTLASGFKTIIQSKYQYISNKTVTVDGINATQLVIKDSSNGDYGSLTFLNKNNSIYIIMISTPDNNLQTINMILNSFKFQ
jgi:hypothetical protein